MKERWDKRRIGTHKIQFKSNGRWITQAEGTYKSQAGANRVAKKDKKFYDRVNSPTDWRAIRISSPKRRIRTQVGWYNGFS